MENREKYFRSFVGLILSLVLIGTIILVATKPPSKNNQKTKYCICFDGPDGSWTAKPVLDTLNGSEFNLTASPILDILNGTLVNLKKPAENTSIWNMTYQQLKRRIKKESKLSPNALNNLVELGEFVNQDGFLDFIDSKLDQVYSKMKKLPPKAFQYAIILSGINLTLSMSNKLVHSNDHRKWERLENWVNEKFPEVENISEKNNPISYKQVSFDEKKDLVLVLDGQDGLFKYVDVEEYIHPENLITLSDKTLNNVVVKIDAILKQENGLKRLIGNAVDIILQMDRQAALRLSKVVYDYVVVPLEKMLLELTYMRNRKKSSF